MIKSLGLTCLVGSVPLLVLALRELAGKDYVAGALIIFGAAAVGHLGLELVALGTERARPTPAPEEEL